MKSKFWGLGVSIVSLVGLNLAAAEAAPLPAIDPASSLVPEQCTAPSTAEDNQMETLGLSAESLRLNQLYVQNSERSPLKSPETEEFDIDEKIDVDGIEIPASPAPVKDDPSEDSVAPKDPNLPDGAVVWGGVAVTQADRDRLDAMQTMHDKTVADIRKAASGSSASMVS